MVPRKTPGTSRRAAHQPERRRAGSARRDRFWWAKLDDEALLKLRFCDLGLRIDRSMLPPALKRLDLELERRGLRFRPHFWLSEEWFSPDGIPGVAIPFYLAHPRLARLERRFMHEVEGGNARWLMRILRHETGHAIDTAYRLHRRKRWRQVFGRASRPYPTSYVPRTRSRSYVLHLGHWYSQSHPAEDFAETFAVWLPPNSAWKTDYESWPAMRKLRYVDELMREIRDERPPVTGRKAIDLLTGNRRTLADHYREKLHYYAHAKTNRYDAELRRVFGSRGKKRGRTRALTLIRRVRPQMRRLLIRRSRLHPYLVHQVMRMVMTRVRELDLCVNRPIRTTERELFGLLERILFDFVRRGRERYAL
jgi:hypothetical protein